MLIFHFQPSVEFIITHHLGLPVTHHSFHLLDMLAFVLGSVGFLIFF